MSDENIIYTIGHSTRTVNEFIEILKENGINEIVDIRTIPHSRHNPQFDIETLPESLEASGIEYAHMDGLGGLRRSRPGSPNTAWINASFRGFADYMQTAEFAKSLDEVLVLSQKKRIALMCAEAVPWRCHRSLIGDALLVRSVKVMDIFGKGSLRVHQLTSFARVEGFRLTYPLLKQA